MDGSNIVLLVERIKKKHPNMVFASIHDCFATQANTAPLLSYLVKESFISIYGSDKFIKNFHEYILYIIKKIYDIENNHVIYPKGGGKIDILEIPKTPLLKEGMLNLKDQLLKSQYFIN